MQQRVIYVSIYSILDHKQVETALASDAARLIADAVESAPEEIKLDAQEIECGSEDQWEVGEDFTNHLLTVTISLRVFF